MFFMLKYYFRRYLEKAIIWVAWHLPRIIVYWSAIRLMTYEEHGNPADRMCIDALKAWGENNVEI